MAVVSYIYTKLRNDGDEAKAIEFLKNNLHRGGRCGLNKFHYSAESESDIPVKKIMTGIIGVIMSSVYNYLDANVPNDYSDEGTFLVALILPNWEVKIFKHKYNIVVNQETSEIE